VSEPDDEQPLADEQVMAWALYRYRLIADALAAPKGARSAILREVAAVEQVAPDGRARRVSMRTLERWLARYQRDSLRGLVRRRRKDRGRSRALPGAALDRAIATFKRDFFTASRPKVVSGEEGE